MPARALLWLWLVLCTWSTLLHSMFTLLLLHLYPHYNAFPPPASPACSSPTAAGWPWRMATGRAAPPLAAG